MPYLCDQKITKTTITMKTNYLFKTLLLLLCLVGGVNVSWAGDFNGSNYDQKVTVPGTFDLSYGTYTGFNRESFFSNGKKIENSKSNAKAVFTFTVSEASEFLLSLEGSNGNGYGDYNCNLEIRIWAAAGAEPSDATKTFTVEDNNNWNDFNAYYLFTDELAAGDYKLSIKWTDQANVQNIKMAAVGSSKYDVSSDEVSLMTNWKTKALVNISNSKYSGYDNMEYTSAYDNVIFIINSQYDCDLDVAFQASTDNDDCSIKMMLVGANGTVLGSETKDITKNGWSTWGDYTTSTSISVSAGYQVLCIKFIGGGSNVKNLKVTPSNIDTGFKDIAIDLRSGQLGTEGSNLQKYLVIDAEDKYSYKDDEPTSYNALLKADSYNGGQHGYVNFKAEIPVKAGYYKVTAGECQYDGSSLSIKNSSDVAQTIYNLYGRSATSYSLNGTCDNSTVGSQLHHQSFWYHAESDETIIIDFDQYTPYFSLEKVSGVPDVQHVVTFAKADGITGTLPETVIVTDGESITLPVNRTLYKSGYTLTAWNDGSKDYAPGASYTPSDHTTLTAVFTANAATLAESMSAVVVKWNLEPLTGIPAINISEGNTGFWVTQASINGKSVDFQMQVDNTYSDGQGKLSNSGRSSWCQANKNTKITIPSLEDAVVEMSGYAAFGADGKTATTIEGSSSYDSSTTLSYTITGSSASTDIIIGNDCGYLSYIQVTYPRQVVPALSSLTVNGEDVASGILTDINTGDAYTATLSGNTYTTVPTVEATFEGAIEPTITVTGTGTSRTYTINDGTRDYTLVVEGIHIYSKGVGEETVNLKYTSDGVSNNVWSNGVYSISPVGDGWNNSGFKLNASNGPFTLSVPSDVQVKQFIIHEFKDNYVDGSFNTITSTGMTTAYIPTKHNLGHTDGEKYDLIINLDDHQAGKDIVFSFTGGSQITGWYELTVAYSDPGTAPVKTAESVTIVNNHAVVAVTFDRVIKEDVTASINGGTVTAEGGATTLYFPIWDLSYSTNYTLTIPAEAVEDNYGNKNASAIEIAVNVPAKAAVTQAAYDYVVSSVDEFDAAIAALKVSNNTKSATRKTIFMKNGNYNFGTTERHVQAHNVSIIGESRDGVVIYGNRTGMNNPILQLRYYTGQYLQDLTVRNDLNWRQNDKEGVGITIQGGEKAVMKNVTMLSNQDTQVTGERAYFENCEIHGTVDFICGGGTNWYERCSLVMEADGYIAAPATSATLKYGYVFNNCTISEAEGVSDTGYKLGRPWLDTPRVTFLNTTMLAIGNTKGWSPMSSSATTMDAYFYEYNSKDGNGDAVDVSSRSVSGVCKNGDYSPVLTAGEAAKYTLKNVLGGTDSWLPTDECPTLSAPASVSISGTTLSWSAVDDARCYVIFKDGDYYSNQSSLSTSLTLTATGVYTVKAANLNGGLGEESDEVKFVLLDENSAHTSVAASSVDVVLQRTIPADKWATIVLPFALNSTQLTSAFGENVQVAQLTSFTDNILCFTSVTSTNANEPYAIKVKDGEYSGTASFSNVTIVEGTPAKTSVSGVDFIGSYAATTNIPASDEDSEYYFFSNNKLWKTASSGTANTMKCTRAYFKIPGTTEARVIGFSIDDETTGISDAMRLNDNGKLKNDNFFDLQGRRVAQPAKGLYIVNGRKVVVK